jgi:hypothetical protein
MFAVMAVVVLPLATAFAGAQSSSAVPPSRSATAALPTSVELLFQFGAQTDRRDATKQIARIDQGGR